MCRRNSRCSIFLLLITAAAVLGTPFSPAAEPAQKIVHLGFVYPGSHSTSLGPVSAFWERLHELGWVEGQNITIETRWADGSIDRLPALVAELIAHKVDVLVTYGTPGGVAAKKATSTVPIVDAVMGDPLRTGLVASLAHPAGNLTGLSLGWAQGLPAKWLELLQETVARLTTVAVIANLENPNEQEVVKELQTAAPAMRLKLRIIDVRKPEALEPAMEQARRQAQAVLVLPDPTNKGPFPQVTALATAHRLPAIYALRDFADAGGLMALGPDLTPMFRQG